MSGIRARVRQELLHEIKRLAREQMAAEGAAAVSLRAIARELGMVSSAIYRYYPSRDDLLTALIIDAYDDIGAAVESADAAVVDRGDLRARWMAVARAVRRWALEHRAEYGLIYGTPVPGYAAPHDTIGPATRVAAVMVRLLQDSTQRAPAQTELTAEISVPSRVRRDLAALRRRLGIDLDDELWIRGLMAWTQLFGAVSFELFGHLHNVVEDHEAFFDHAMELTALRVGL